MPVTIALAEELLYRGCLLPRFQARMGRAVGFVVVALGFGIQHIAFSLGDWRSMLARTLSLFLAGLAIAGLNEEPPQRAPRP